MDELRVISRLRRSHGHGNDVPDRRNVLHVLWGEPTSWRYSYELPRSAYHHCLKCDMLIVLK